MKKSIFFCKECGYESMGYMGKCTACGAWDSFKEAPKLSKSKPKSEKILFTKPESKLIALSEIAEEEISRNSTRSQELDRVLGGGIVSGSLTLVGGEPGIGKSTLLLQLANSYSLQKLKVLYISAEESSRQLKLRASRLGIKERQEFDIEVLAENDLNKIIDIIECNEPDLVIVDSIQAIYIPNLDSIPGSPSQIRECAGNLMRLAKASDLPIFLVGHINKDGDIAGPKILEHMVDTVLYFEGSQDSNIRFLRSIKNRFGCTDEVGIFSMENNGLRDLTNPSAIFLEQKSDGIIFAAKEGKRSLLLELQALVVGSEYHNPRRSATGIGLNRLNQIIAILEKHLQLSLAKADVYLNVVGGINLKDTASDLAIALAIYNSASDQRSDLVALGELGLSGEVRAIHDIEARIKEAIKLGLKRIVIPQANAKKIDLKKFAEIEIVAIKKLSQAIEANKSYSSQPVTLT